MADISLRHEINCDEDTYWSKIVFDEAFNKAMYVDHLGIVWTLLDSKEDDAKITRRIHVEPPMGNLPGPVKKVLGDKLAYTEEGTFDKKTRRYALKVVPSTLAEKTKVTGEMWCEKAGDKKVIRHAKFHVEVKVMLVGGMVEDRIVEDLRASYEKGTVFTNDYLAKHGL